jgi:hypothetical protein
MSRCPGCKLCDECQETVDKATARLAQLRLVHGAAADVVAAFCANVTPETQRGWGIRETVRFYRCVLDAYDEAATTSPTERLWRNHGI